MSGQQQQSQNVSQQQQQQVPEKFLKPFYKLSVAQLNEAWKRDGVWRQQFGKTEVELGMVWLQGVVELLDRENDWLEMSQEDARVRVLGVSSSPGGDAWVNEGQYIQVIGQPNGEDGERYVECKTLRDLTSSRVAKDLWPLEVAELQGLLGGRLTVQQ